MLTCELCNKIFNNRPAKSIHKKKCYNVQSNINELKEINKQKELELKIKQEEIRLKQEEKEILQLKIKLKKDDTIKINEENINLKKELKNINLTKIKEDIADIKNNPPLNNQLINIISDKNKKIEELSKNIQLNNQIIIEKQIKTFESLTLNNIVITSRSDDNFINATQLCQAGGKQFNDWYRLNTTKQLINELAWDADISASQSKNRLSTYNKTCDHQVIYHKKCVDEEILTLVENMVLNKLKQYQEKANRDRFILPFENDISLFTNIVENCINFFE